MMGLEETIAATLDDYVVTAVRLAHDIRWRTAIKEKIASNKDRVYRDSSSILALQQFLESVVARIAPDSTGA